MTLILSTSLESIFFKKQIYFWEVFLAEIEFVFLNVWSTKYMVWCEHGQSEFSVLDAWAEYGHGDIF